MKKFDPLKHLFNKIDRSRCLAKWVMLLTKFDLKFFLQKAIKGQALTDHLTDAPSPLALPSNDSFPDDSVLTTDVSTWELYFDGSKCRKGYGARVILVLPKGKPIPLSHRLNFLCTNNTVEYEVLIVGLHANLLMGVKDIRFFGYSQLAIKQINGTYQAKHDKLSK